MKKFVTETRVIYQEKGKNTAFLNGLNALAQVLMYRGIVNSQTLSTGEYKIIYGEPLWVNPEMNKETVYIQDDLQRILTLRDSKIHWVKSDPEYFALNLTGEKQAEMRKNDRNYKTGDFVILQEYDRNTKEYTRNALAAEIGMVIYGGEWLKDGYCFLTLHFIHGVVERIVNDF